MSTPGEEWRPGVVYLKRNRRDGGHTITWHQTWNARRFAEIQVINTLSAAADLKEEDKTAYDVLSVEQIPPPTITKRK